MRYLLVSALLFISLLSAAQVAPEKYWVQFTDKDNSPYSLLAPEAYLSARSIERRVRQNIAISTRDLPVDPAYVAGLQSLGGEVLCVSKWMNSVTVKVTDDQMLQQILALPYVIAHRPVGKQRSPSAEWAKGELVLDFKTLNDFPTDEDYGSAFNQIEMLNGVALHRSGLMGEGMMIAVLDAGFTLADQLPVFNALYQEGRLAGTRDVVGRTSNVYGYSTHGTAVLSTMAAYEPGLMIGTAPKASYLLIRTEDVGSEFPIEEDFWVTGAEYADSMGADILNTSLGYTTFDDPAYDYTYADMDGNTTTGARGSNMAAATGMLVVTSAGNMGNNPWQFISTPADADSALTIGAVTPEEQPASFSSKGPTADGRIKPNVCTQGQQAIVANSTGGVGPSNGTSFSGPIMAGMAACLWQSAPDATNMQIFRAIERSAHLFQMPTDKMGYGIPDLVQARLALSGYLPLNTENDEVITVYPNPLSTDIKGVFYSASDQELEIRLVNGLGQTVRKLTGRGCQVCMHNFRFDGLDVLPIGVYHVQVLGKNGKFNFKVLKAE